MPKHIVIATIRALLAVALCVYCFISFVHVTTIDNPRMARLAVKVPGVPLVIPKASSTSNLDLITSPFPTVHKSFLSDPTHTGGYSVIWNGAPATKRSAVMVLDLLPSHQLQQKTLAEARKQFFSTKAFKVYSKEVPVRVPQIPGAVAYKLYSAATPQEPASQTVMTIFGYGRVEVVELVSALTMPISDATVLAMREYKLLQKVEPTFQLSFTSRPIVGTIFYVLGSLVLVAAAFMGPTLIAEARIRRKEAQEAAIRRHKQVRGSKNLRRRRARSTRR